MKKLLCSLALLFMLTGLYAQHVVTLRSGEKMTGKVQSMNDNMIKFSFKGNEMNLKVSDVSSIEFDDHSPSKSNQVTPASSKGVSYVMSGRKMIKEPKIDNLTMEKGIVVVEITINKYGNVVKSVPGIEGSTTTSNYLLTKAKQAAESAKFDTSPIMPLEQKGSITITF